MPMVLDRRAHHLCEPDALAHTVPRRCPLGRQRHVWGKRAPSLRPCAAGLSACRSRQTSPATPALGRAARGDAGCLERQIADRLHLDARRPTRSVSSQTPRKSGGGFQPRRAPRRSQPVRSLSRVTGRGRARPSSSLCSRNSAMISSFCCCSRGKIDMTSFGGESGGIPSSICAMIRCLTVAPGRRRDQRPVDGRNPRTAITPPTTAAASASTFLKGRLLPERFRVDAAKILTFPRRSCRRGQQTPPGPALGPGCQLPSGHPPRSASARRHSPGARAQRFGGSTLGPLPPRPRRPGSGLLFGLLGPSEAVPRRVVPPSAEVPLARPTTPGSREA